MSAPAIVRNGRVDDFAATTARRLRHPVVGELELGYEVSDVSADDALTISVYSAEPASRSADALDLLTGWSATQERVRAPAEE